MSYKDLQNRLGYTFKDEALIELALTHKSLAIFQTMKDLNFWEIQFLILLFQNIFSLDLIIKKKAC